jgi:autotransporter-associated beta strand protein
VTLTGSNTYTGFTTISAGTLQIGNGGSGEFLASPSVAVSSSAALVFSQSDSMVYSGVVSGSGSLTQNGPGVVTLTGSNTYTGGTMISAGTLQIGDGGSGEFLASPSVSVANSAALVFNLSDSLAYSGAISGGGGLTQTGSGELILSGSNYYTGGTTVSGGTLVVESPYSLPTGSSLFVGDGASSLFAPAAGPAIENAPAAAVPEPGSLALLGVAGFVAAAFKRRLRRRLGPAAFEALRLCQLRLPDHEEQQRSIQHSVRDA